MATCDSLDKITRRQSGCCLKCHKQNMASDEPLFYMDWPECIECGANHLYENMVEKLKGRMCESCASEYEKDLYEKSLCALGNTAVE